MICKMNIYKLHFTKRDRTRDKVHCTLALELSQCREKALTRISTRRRSWQGPSLGNLKFGEGLLTALLYTVHVAARGRGERGHAEDLLLDVLHLQHPRAVPGQVRPPPPERGRHVQLVLPVGRPLPRGPGETCVMIDAVSCLPISKF